MDSLVIKWRSDGSDHVTKCLSVTCDVTTIHTVTSPPFIYFMLFFLLYFWENVGYIHVPFILWITTYMHLHSTYGTDGVSLFPFLPPYGCWCFLLKPLLPLCELMVSSKSHLIVHRKFHFLSSWQEAHWLHVTMTTGRSFPLSIHDGLQH